MIEYVVTSWNHGSANGPVPEILDSFTSAEDATSYVAESLDLDPDVIHRAFDTGVIMFDRGETVYCIVECHTE